MGNFDSQGTFFLSKNEQNKTCQANAHWNQACDTEVRIHKSLSKVHMQEESRGTWNGGKKPSTQSKARSHVRTEGGLTIVFSQSTASGLMEAVSKIFPSTWEG